MTMKVAGVTTIMLMTLMTLMGICKGKPMEKAATWADQQCAAYSTTLVEEEKAFEIRRYANATPWISVSMRSTSFSQATSAGTQSLRAYYQGQNLLSISLPPTTPLLTDLFRPRKHHINNSDDGKASTAAAASSSSAAAVRRIRVSRPAPTNETKEHRAPGPNKESGLKLRKWRSFYVAVSRFDANANPLDDATVESEAEKLLSALNDAALISAVARGKGIPLYSVAQYTSPSTLTSPLYEIWIHLNASYSSAFSAFPSPSPSPSSSVTSSPSPSASSSPSPSPRGDEEAEAPSEDAAKAPDFSPLGAPVGTIYGDANVEDKSVGEGPVVAGPSADDSESDSGAGPAQGYAGSPYDQSLYGSTAPSPSGDQPASDIGMPLSFSI